MTGYVKIRLGYINLRLIINLSRLIQFELTLIFLYFVKQIILKHSKLLHRN